MADYLMPLSVLPVNDRELEDIFRDAVMGITGLPSEMVRPRWQQTVPNQPEFEVNWVAVGVDILEQDTFAYERHVPSLEAGGANVVERDEQLRVLCSFYGANNFRFMSQWREGLAIEQNRFALEEHGIKLVAIDSRPVNVPALFKNTWVRRIDLGCQFSRRVEVTYGVRTVRSVGVDLHTEELPVQHIQVDPSTIINQ